VIQLEKSFFENLNKNKIAELLALAQPYWNYRANMYRRFLRKDSPTGIMGSGKDKVAVPFEYYIVSMVQGYLSGKPPEYKVADSEKYEAREYQKKIDYIRRYNDDAATFTELIHDFITKSAAYLYITQKEDGEIV